MKRPPAGLIAVPLRSGDAGAASPAAVGMPPEGSHTELIEQWFAWYGVPHFIKDFGAHRDVPGHASRFLIRVYPFQVAVEAAVALGWRGLLAVVPAWLLALAARRANRPPGRLIRRSRAEVAAWTGIFLLTGPTIALAAGATRWPPLIMAGVNLGLILLLLAGTALMLGSVLAWVARRVMRECLHLGKLAARGVPMLSILTLVAFVSSDMWRVAYDMTAPRLLAVLALFIVTGLVFLWVRLAEEIDKRVNNPNGMCRSFTGKEVRDAWGPVEDAGEPHAHGEERKPPARRVRLRAWGQRIHRLIHRIGLCRWTHNKELPPLGAPSALSAMRPQDPELGEEQIRNMRFYLLLCQVIQVGLLTVVVWLFFLVFGWLAVTNKVVTDWFAPTPLQYPRLFGLSIPVFSTQLLDASALLAILSGAFFAVSAIADSDYRDEFFDRTANDLMRAVCVRCGYLVLLRQPGPGDPPGPVRPELGWPGRDG